MNILILVLSILAGLIILTILVVIHELGHAIAAKRNGVKVEEFGIGFPPKAWSKTLPKSILGEKKRFQNTVGELFSRIIHPSRVEADVITVQKTSNPLLSAAEARLR